MSVPAGCELKDPSGATHDDKEMAGQKNGLVAKEAGLYTVSDKAGKQGFVYAVNIDPAEMDTATVSADEIASAVEQPKEEIIGGAVAGLKEGAKEQDGGRLWWYVAAAVGALFAMELFVANRTMRH